MGSSASLFSTRSQRRAQLYVPVIMAVVLFDVAFTQAFSRSLCSQETCRPLTRLEARLNLNSCFVDIVPVPSGAFSAQTRWVCAGLLSVATF